MKMKRTILTAMFGLLAAGTLSVYADELPPSNSKPLSRILKSVEGQHSGTLAKAEFDDGLWEVKACKATSCDKLYLSPTTGKEVRRKMTEPEELPAANAMALSSIVQRVEATQHGSITEIEFEDTHPAHWEVTLRNGLHKTKLLINPTTGRTLQ